MKHWYSGLRNGGSTAGRSSLPSGGRAPRGDTDARSRVVWSFLRIQADRCSRPVLWSGVTPGTTFGASARLRNIGLDVPLLPDLPRSHSGSEAMGE